MINLLLGGLILVYPLIIYWGMQYFSPQWLAGGLILLLLVRLSLSSKTVSKIPWLKPASLSGILVLLYSVVQGSSLGMLLYPVVINSTLFVVFIFSLLFPPSIIETFALIKTPHLDQAGVEYCRQVTKVWCLFFIINGVISLYTVLFATIEQWMLYNGFISYLLIGLLMSVEFIVRIQVKKRNMSV